ncbi:immunoglobulin alpha-2 heavy chain-like [Chiloscyllium punctatum]|uniref:immunoglobulin alpha-2 heavy chain-like n=1 Tax=Chiloscyllium punctatum TaxID=137246 RepID=UPI003B63EC25
MNCVEKRGCHSIEIISGYLFAVTLSLCITSGANVPDLLQYPILERVTEGHTARLLCTMRNAAVTDTDVYWYWEQPGGRTVWILRHYTSNYIQLYSGFTEQFQPSRDLSSNSFILTITNVQPSDTGVYYCSVWGSIYGRGSQLIVDKKSSDGIPWTSDSILIIGTILGFTVLIRIVLLTYFLWKRKLCPSVKDSTQGSPVEDENIVHPTVNDRTWSSEQAAVPPVVLAEGKCHYAEVHFHQQGSSQPTVTAAERSSEYAVIKWDRN